MSTIATFSIVVSGFTQDRGYVHGMLELREKLIIAGHSSGSKERVWYLPWTVNYGRVASDLVHICSKYGYIPKVNVCGYSYGGWGAIKMCKALEYHGIHVKYLILSDPVARPWYWPRPLPALTSLLSREYSFKLTVPSNVHELFSFYQEENRPQGHQLVCVQTKQHCPVKLQYTHQRMDDALEFHGQVLKCAKNLIGG